jgi:hypothetical protein
VIKDKYLPYESVHTWLRSASAVTTYGSQTWKNLINSLPLVLQWLAWNSGSGHSIVIGKDVILGMGKDSFLSKELVDSLNQKNVHLLYQASCDLLQGTLCSTWLDCTTLELEGDLALEWEKYKNILISSGIHLQDHPDVLLWTGGDNSGQLMVKNVYNAVATKLWNLKVGGWRRKLWKWDCPLKIKLFTWLVAENKILTWKNLQKRGWVGPGICFLCKGKRETGKHLFVNCPFTISVWNMVKIALKLSSGWTGLSVNECFENWTKKNLIFLRCLPSYAGIFGMKEI